MIFNKCQCCMAKLIEAIKNIKCSSDIPQPLDVNCSVPQPLPVSFGQPVAISGTVNCISSASSDPCTEAIIKILSQSSSFNEIVFDTGEQFQKAEDVKVDGYILSFSSQGQKIQAPVCNVEYVVL